jgi:hypothetical protein
MALTKESVIDKIEIVGEFKHVQVRTATVVKEDGVELSRSFHRHVVAPNADTSGEDAQVQAICSAVHTDEVKAAYQAHLDAQAAEMGTDSSE